MRRLKFWLLLFLATPAMLFAAGEVYRPAVATPPAPAREFRGAWLATVANIDWPSKPGLTTAEQKAELILLLDRAVQLKLNAIVFQVRPACDAVYASTLEPWSPYLSGTMGKAPAPFYDPLAFAIEECHKRGLELHAWFNPFRAAHPLNKSPTSANHITRTHPEFIRHYGSQTWLDPGEPAVRAYVTRVVMDVVERYDVDGVQFDDYFYPYPEKTVLGREINFPDNATWQKYGMPRNFDLQNWRRSNVNQFIQGVYQTIKSVKPWVKVGISPFGIWRPHNPFQIMGLDAYDKLYADSRLWLASGWLDYCSPQLYWAVDPPAQSFPVLLNWWSQQNLKHRHLWPGYIAANVGGKWDANEIGRQIKLTRFQPGAGGGIFYHLRNLTDPGALNEVVHAQYIVPALVPASPWLDATLPATPQLNAVVEKKSNVSVRWDSPGGKRVWKWVVQFENRDSWTTEILEADQTSLTFSNLLPDVIVVRAVDRLGNLSLPVALKKATPVHRGKVTMFE